MRTKRAIGRACLYAGVVLLVVFSLFPIYWLVLSAFKPLPTLLKYPPTLFTLNLTLDNFIKLFRLTSFLRFFLNTILMCFVTIVVALPIAVFGAYGLTRFKFPGRENLAKLALFVYMVPPILLVIPLYLTMAKLHLGDTLIGLILIYIACDLPFSLWLLRSFFHTVPIELEEAAFIDGASRLQVIIRIFLPVAFPGIVASTVWSLSVVWNEYIFAFVLISTATKKNIPTGLSTFVTEFEVLWEYILAGSTVALIPIVAFFLFFQKYLIEGWASGGVKG
jgi:ABC-type glycerol-3-phosphate transport system permease component